LGVTDHRGAIDQASPCDPPGKPGFVCGDRRSVQRL